MDDLDLLKPKTPKDKAIYWISFIAGILITAVLIWQVIRVKP
jgi:hypothetical protein